MVKLVKLTENRFVYQCDKCGWEGKTMTRTESQQSGTPSHTCKEDFSQAAARIVREATKG